jgi:hypothetical protein
MKKVLVLLVLSACAAGCGGPASQSDMWKHDTMYRNWDHLRFSWGGHKEAGGDVVKKSENQNWWGKEVPVEIGK